MTRRPRQPEATIHLVPLGRITVLEITEAELEALERGSPESLYLNLAIATLSAAFSFLTSLLTTTITDVRMFCVFVILCVAGFISGTTYALLWWRMRGSLRSVAHEIRARMAPPEGIREDDPPALLPK